MFNNNHFKFNIKSLFLITMVVFCAGLFAVNVGTASAETIIVQPGESIQAAIDSLGAGGGTVELTEGTWAMSSTIHITKSNITLKGAGMDKTILTRATPGISPLIDINKTGDAIERIAWHYNNKSQSWIFSYPRNPFNSDAHIWNIVVKDLCIKGGGSGDDYGIYAAELVDSTILNVKTENHDMYGMVVGCSVNATVENCTSIADGGLGELFACPSCNLIGCTVINANRYDGYKSNGVWRSTYTELPAYPKPLVIRNRFVGGGAGGFYIYATTDAVVSENIAENCSRYGMSVCISGQCLISENILRNNGLDGLLYKTTNRYWENNFTNNLIYNNGDNGFEFHQNVGGSLLGGRIVSNTIWNNNGDGIYNPHSQQSIVTKNNIIANNKGYGINGLLESMSYNDVWNNTLGDYNGVSAGAGDISIDPLFASTISGSEDFHLKSQFGRWNGSSWANDSQTSSCVDTGDASDDYSLEPLPNGDRINMGSYGNIIYASKSSGEIPPDTTPPYTSSHNPAKNAINVSQNTNITVYIEDDGDGVNQSSIEMTAEGVVVSPTITGTPADCTLTYNPVTDFSYNQVVNVTIDAQDLAETPNTMSTDIYSFTIEEEPVASDTTSPSAITNLSTSNPTSNSITLNYTSPGDDNNTGTASAYDIRYFTSEITGVNWNSATQCAGEATPQSAGSTETFIVPGLSFETTYYFAIKTLDEVPNTSDISNCVNGITLESAGDLVAHYKFDENFGTTAIDSSGNNNGTLINMDPATDWIEGKIGTNAIQFDGTDDYVDCGNDESLNITGAITVEAWVKMDSSEQAGIVGKYCETGNQCSYVLYHDSSNYFRGLITADGSTASVAYSDKAYTSITDWYHIAFTYQYVTNGTSIMIVYVNGVAGAAKTSAYGPLFVSSQDLIIGQFGCHGGNYWSFPGKIDDVRIYSRALTAAEVLAHYNEGNEPEINHDPIGSLDTANQSSITGWAYDQNSDSNPIDVHIYIDGNLIDLTIADESRPDLVEAGVTPDPNHGFTFSTPTDLSIGEHTVNVYAINQPEGTNPELIGSPKTFIVSSSDIIPPIGSIQINSGDAKTNSQTVNLSILASDPSGLSEMKISNTNDFNSVVAETYNTIKTFILSPIDGLKTVYIWFKDTIGNWNTEPYSDTITLDSTSPTISNISVSNITTNTATINFQTNEDSTSHIEYGLTSNYGSASALDSALATIHSISLSGLSADTNYHFKIISKDELENESNSIDQTFKTIGLPDTIPPAKITDLSSSNITQTSADLLWTSKGDDGNNGTSASYDIRYSRQNPSDLSGQALQSWWDSATQLTGEPIPSSSGTEEYVSVGLSSNTNYYFIIKSADEVPNWSDYSNILFLKTLEETTPPPPSSGGGTVSDTTPPSQPTNFKAIPADSQITLNWKNPSDSDFVRVTILRISADPTLILTPKNAEELFKGCPTNCQNQNIVVIYEGNKQQYTDINLNNETTYYYSIFSYDKKPNYSEILSISSKPEKGKTSIEIPNGNETYPEGTLLKTPDSFKIYIIINQKKKWIPTPEVFETLGYQWTEIIEIDKNELTLIPDYEDNLIRAINDFKVYLIVNGIKRHIPNPEIFLNYGFEWNEVKDVNQETINQYTQCNLIKESKKEEVYYLCPTRKIKRWLRSPEIFNSYPDNNWNNIQVISKYEMDHYPESNLIQLIGDNNVYLIENNRKRLINSVEEFEREGLDWGKVMGVGNIEFQWFGR